VAGGNEAAVAGVVSAVTLRLDAVGIHDFLRPAFAAMFVAGSDLKLKERVLARLDRLEAQFARELLLGATCWEERARAQLQRLEVPVLLVQSTYLDGQFEWHRLEPGRSTPWIDLVKNSVSDCKVEMLRDSGHFSPVESADAVNERLLEFLERVRSEPKDDRVRE
jgi:pimeloyl-ACP methyl ester carboxylesterase